VRLILTLELNKTRVDSITTRSPRAKVGRPVDSHQSLIGYSYLSLLRSLGVGGVLLGFLGLLLFLLFLLLLLLLFLLVLLGVSLLLRHFALSDGGLSGGLLGGGGGSGVNAQLLSNLVDVGGLVGVSEEKLPGFGSRVGHSSVLVELALLLEISLLLGEGAELPLLLVDVTVHDDTLGSGNDSVVASGDSGGGHLGDRNGDGLTLGGDDNDLGSDFNAGFVAEDTGEHELGTVADGVDGGVLDHNTGVAGQEDLERHDNSTQVLLVVVLLEVPLGVLDVVHGNHGLVFLEGSGTHTSELLHVSTAAEEVTQMDAEGSNVSSSFAGDPENTHVAFLVVLNEVELVDGSHTELLLDGGNKRGSLETGTSEGVEGLLDLLDLVEALMELENGNVLFSGALLGLDESGGVVDAHDEAASDLGVEGAGVTGFVNLEDFLDPGDDLMGGRVGGLVEVDHTVSLEDIDGTVSGGVAAGKGSEVGGLHIELIEVLQATK